eukprot:GGOE01014987.1.p1 GENE.GGOE01014987.1~~GGOE01014987.1.p1  ORF type:complete len:1202 (+),score=240.01 GGOE01014987.1:56-3661(+)
MSLFEPWASQPPNQLAEVIYQWSLKNPTNWKHAEAERRQWLQHRAKGSREKVPSVGHSQVIEQWHSFRTSTEKFHSEHAHQQNMKQVLAPVAALAHHHHSSTGSTLAKHVSFPDTLSQGAMLGQQLTGHNMAALGSSMVAFEVTTATKRTEVEGDRPLVEEAERLVPEPSLRKEPALEAEEGNGLSATALEVRHVTDTMLPIGPATVQVGPSPLELMAAPQLSLLHPLRLDDGSKHRFLQVRDLDEPENLTPVVEVVRCGICADETSQTTSSASLVVNLSSSLDSERKAALLPPTTAAATAAAAVPSAAPQQEEDGQFLQFAPLPPDDVPPLLPQEVADAMLGQADIGRPTEQVICVDSGPEVWPTTQPAAPQHSPAGDIADLLLGQVIQTLGTEALRKYLHQTLGTEELTPANAAAPPEADDGESPKALQFSDATLDVLGQCVHRGLPPLQDLDPVDLQRTVRRCVSDAIREMAAPSSSTAAMDPDAEVHLPRAVTVMRVPEAPPGTANETHLLRLVVELLVQDMDKTLRRTYGRQRQRQARRRATSQREPGDEADDDGDDTSGEEVPLLWPDPIPHEEVAWDDTQTQVKAVPKPRALKGAAVAGGGRSKRQSQHHVAFQMPPANTLSPQPQPPLSDPSAAVPDPPPRIRNVTHAFVQTSATTESLPLLGTSHFQTSPLCSDTASQAVAAAPSPLLLATSPTQTSLVPPQGQHAAMQTVPERRSIHAQTTANELNALGDPVPAPIAHPGPASPVLSSAIVTPLTLGLLNGQLVLLPVGTATTAGLPQLLGAGPAVERSSSSSSSKQEAHRERRRKGKGKERRKDGTGSRAKERLREREGEALVRDDKEPEARQESRGRLEDRAVAEVLLTAERLALESQRLAVETDRQRVALGAERLAQLQSSQLAPTTINAAPSAEPSAIEGLEERWMRHQEAAERRFEDHQTALHSRWLEHSEALQSEQQRWLGVMQDGLQQSLDNARSQQHGMARLAEVEYRLLKAMQLEVELRQELVEEEGRQCDWLESNMARERAWIQPVMPSGSGSRFHRRPPSVSSGSSALTDVSVSTTNPSSVASSIGRLVFATTRVRFDDSLSEGEVECLSEGEVVEQPLRDVVYGRPERWPGAAKAAMGERSFQASAPSEGEVWSRLSLRSSWTSSRSAQTEGELQASCGERLPMSTLLGTLSTDSGSGADFDDDVLGGD